MTSDRFWATLFMGFSFSMSLILYFLLRERLQQKRRARTINNESKPMKLKILLNIDSERNKEYTNEEYSDDEADSLLCNEPCSLAVICWNGRCLASICVCLDTKNVFYFVEQNNFESEEFGNNNVDEKSKSKLVKAVMSVWADKWVLVKNVDCLVDHFQTAKFNSSKSDERSWLLGFQRNNDCRVFVQCADNFVCDQHSNELFWLDTVRRCRQLLSLGEDVREFDDYDDIWQGYILQKWTMKRIRPNHFKPLINID